MYVIFTYTWLIFMVNVEIYHTRIVWGYKPLYLSGLNFSKFERTPEPSPNLLVIDYHDQGFAMHISFPKEGFKHHRLRA